MVANLDICPSPSAAPATVPNNIENIEIRTLKRNPEVNKKGIHLIRASNALIILNWPAAWLAKGQTNNGAKSRRLVTGERLASQCTADAWASGLITKGFNTGKSN
jgi:hypothetical protein